MDSLVAPLLAAPADRPLMMARIVSLHGFGLRDRSDGAVIDPGPDGRVAGQILGGLFDAQLLDLAGQAHRRVVSLRADDAAAEAIGMVCGGTARVLLSPIGALPELFTRSLRSAEPVAVACLADGSSVDVAVTRRAHDGTTGDAELDDALIEAARSMLAAGSSTTGAVEPPTKPGCEVLVAAVVPRARGLIVGSGAMAEAIEAQGKLLAWEITITEDLESALDWCRAGAPADALVVLSHDLDLTTPILAAALDSAVGYVGAMGSRGTQTNRRKRLVDSGVADRAIARVNGPVGLNLGGRNPAETAVAIAAEYLSARSGRAVESLREATGSING